jgi:ribosome recycling factor
MKDQVLQEAEGRMDKAVESIGRELARIRTGKAALSLLEAVRVECYGTSMPVNQVATISIPEPRLMVIQPWDRSLLQNIEKAILKSELGITPSSDGAVIRLAIPSLTEERRGELQKLVRKLAEDTRVQIRMIRREANEELRRLEKNGELPEDEAKKAQDETQKLTDSHIEQVDRRLESKEKEILED